MLVVGRIERRTIKGDTYLDFFNLNINLLRTRMVFLNINANKEFIKGKIKIVISLNSRLINDFYFLSFASA